MLKVLQLNVLENLTLIHFQIRINKPWRLLPTHLPAWLLPQLNLERMRPLPTRLLPGRVTADWMHRVPARHLHQERGRCQQRGMHQQVSGR